MAKMPVTAWQKLRRGWLALAMLVSWAGWLTAQPGTTAIADVVYHADGSPATGTVLISWPAFTTSAGQSVPKGSLAVLLPSGGALNVSLTPNAGATPIGTYYTVVYHLNDGSTSREYWAVPASGAVQKLNAVRASVLPTSVAVQTVSKTYVDQAIAKAALGGGLPAGSTAYVQVSGDTMTGALVLPGDPVSALQAATKNYVDASTAAVQAGLGQKVSTVPIGTQTVTQPAGTQLRTNSLNGSLYATQYLSQIGNDGISNAAGTSDCANGCEVTVEHTYPGIDRAGFLKNGTHVQDHRGGALGDVYFNPHSPFDGEDDAQRITVISTRGAAELAAAYNRSTTDSTGLRIRHSGLTGGNNIFPQNISSNLPYFKSTYSALQLEGTYSAQGQHVLDGQTSHCYGVGDCLIGARFLYGSGGIRDNADEGEHFYDLVVSEDPNVFQGVCTTGCASGSTHLLVSATTAPGTQGEGRYLIDKAPAKVITAGSLVGGGRNAFPHATGVFTGTSFPVSVFFTLVNAIPPQSNNMAPGTVTAAIQTSGAYTGYATNTAAAPATSGVACIADAQQGGNQGAHNHETAAYSVVDGTHLQLVLNKPHAGGATVAIGGLCGYGLEQLTDTVNGIRQVFPVVGSNSSTSLFYASGAANLVGAANSPSGYFNGSFTIASIVRNANTVTVTTAGNPQNDLNGLSLTISGVTDSSYNGTFVVTTTAPNQFTYAQAGANSSSSGGTAGLLTGGYALYPMAEVLSVYNGASESVDGTMGLAANTVAWAAGDPVEQPHYYLQRVAPDTEFVTQWMPRPALTQSAGVEYDGVNSSGLHGWSVSNYSPPSMYFGNGGTHLAPDVALQVNGVWSTSMAMQAGDQSAFFVSCNSHGCGKWNSAYNLFSLQNSVGNGALDTVTYAPNTSTMSFNMRGAQYSMSPTALTAGTINATTLNVSTLNATNVSLPAATASAAGAVKLGAAAANNVLANVATSGAATDVAGLAASATVDTTNASNITSGTISAARLPPGAAGGNCASTVPFSATPAFAATCANPVFHMAMTGSVTAETFSGLTAGQRITLVFQTGATGGYTVQWSAAVHGGFGTSGTAGSPLYMQPGRYFVQQLIVDADGTTLLNPGAINE